MPRYEYVVQVVIDAATTEEGKAWLQAELDAKLQPGAEGSPWKTTFGETPRFNLAGVRSVNMESPVPQRRKE